MAVPTMRDRILGLTVGLRTEDAQVIANVLGLDPVDVERVFADPSYVPSSGGSGSPGGSVVRKFPFDYNTPGLAAGAALYMPTIGDILLDAWIEINTAWNGTTPLGDLGVFDIQAGGAGYFSDGYGLVIDMATADTDLVGANLLSGGRGYVTTNGNFSLQTGNIGIVVGGAVGHGRTVPGKFLTAAPIKVCVSQDGSITGADPGSTQGAAILYLVTATPV